MRARTPETLDPAFDREPVAMGRREVKFPPRIHHGNADQAIFLDDVLLGEAGRLEQDRGRVVEHLEVARVIDDVGGVAVTPLNLHITPMNEHAIFPSAAPCEARHRAAPPRHSDTDCRSCAAPGKRTRRLARAAAETGSTRPGCPAPPAASWPTAGSET